MKLRFPIGYKMGLLIFGLLAASISGVVYFSTQLYVSDNTALIQQMNADTASGLATQVRGSFEGAAETLRLIGMNLLSIGGNPSSQSQLTANLLPKEGIVRAVQLLRRTDGDAQRTGGQSIALEEWQADEESRNLILSQHDWNGLYLGRPLVVPSSSPTGKAVILIGIPLVSSPEKSGEFEVALVGILDSERFLKSFSESDLAESFLVGPSGAVVAHPQREIVEKNISLAHSDIVQELLSGKFNNGQKRYVNPQTGEARLGAYSTVGFGGLGVVTEVPEAKAFEAANRVVFRSLLTAVFFGSLALLLGYHFSSTITSPLRRLVRATGEIAKGNFAVRMRPKTRDEISDLSRAFNQMAEGLEERERIKATFAKFHNQEIVDTLLSGEVNLGGQKQPATILFTDLRGFTGMSEFLPPEKTVEMLNEYLSRMVTVIRKHGGIVDKFVGDAILAVWGVPFPDPESAKHAVRACLELRQELVLLNQARTERGDAPLKMGMGINFGEILCGNIGSQDRMEYTVIGSTVNTASRLESLTKEFETDLLVSHAVVEQCGSEFQFNRITSIAVRGQQTETEIFAVSEKLEQQGGGAIQPDVEAA